MKGYDEKYLQSCIDKAKKSWEGVDTDKFMNEVRGREDAPSEELDDAARKAYPPMSRISEPHGVIPADNKSHYLGDANEENRAAFKAGAEWQRKQMEDEHRKELLYVCQKTAEREHRSGVREGKAQAISHIRNQVKLWMPDNPEGDEYEAGKRLAFASVLQYLKELEAQQDDICSGCTNVKGCATCVNGNMKETSEDKELEEEK